jgi:hypothetical protein
MEETELATCVRVLRRLSSSAASIEAVATTSAYRDLRKAMAPIVSDAMQRRHGGLAPMEYARRRQLRKEALVLWLLAALLLAGAALWTEGLTSWALLLAAAWTA